MFVGLKTILLGAVVGLMAAVPSSTNYTLRNYDIGSGGSASSSSTNYKLNGVTGTQSGVASSTSYKDNSGLNPAQNSNVPTVASFTNPNNYYNKLNLIIGTANKNGNSFYFAEQITPDPVKEIPQYYPTLLNRLNQYSEIQTNLGNAALTHPKELNGNQTAVLNLNGTLMFIRPQNNISDNEWKDFINSLIMVR